MQKDVIYIDTEDDITAIIGKVKAANAKIVALVPPKRIGAIQSAVNLKLVHRAAEQADKRLVIISNNAALMALAGSAGIPVAKNLQSKPELAEIPALEVDEGEDIIDGTAPVEKAVSSGTDASVAAVEAIEASDGMSKKAATAGALGTAAIAKAKAKIPDFNTFRKKLFIIIAAAMVLIGGLIWALIFAPTAHIAVTARTSDVALNTQVNLASNVSTSLKEGTIALATKTTKKDVSITVPATGKKDVGEKATGAVKFSTNNISNLGTTIPAGTTLTSSGGSTYTTDTAVTMTISNYTGAPSGITATQSGTKYNGATGSMSGTPSGISATITATTTGGTDKTITVLQQSDIDTVSDKILSSSDSDAARAALKKQFGSDYIVLDSSFKSDQSAVKASPAVGEEVASGNATLAGSVVFSMSAVSTGEMEKFLTAYFEQSIDGKTSQKIYDNGVKAVSFTNVNATAGGFSANITTNGKIGPKIDENALREYAKGKRFGEIQSYAQTISGIEGVKVDFSPFWVTSAPNDVKRITVEFKVND